MHDGAAGAIGSGVVPAQHERMPWRAPVVIAVAAAGVTAGVALIPLLDTDAAASRGAYGSPALALIIGWGFVGTGLFMSLRRPDNRIGPLMLGVGFAWYVSSLIGSDVALLHTASLFGGSLWSALLIHMVLAFPSGRLRTRAERRVVAGAYVVATVLQAPPLLFSESAGLTCARCPRNLALIESAPTVAGALFTFQLVCATGVVVSGCAVLLRRWQHSSPPQRRAMSPVIWSAGGAGLLAVLSFATALAGQDAASAAIDWAYVTLFASIPFAFLVGLLRSRLFRAQALSELVRRLADRPRPGRLRDVLAHTLGDRALAIAYWLPAQACYVDAGAQPVELRAAGSGQAATSIELDGRRVAAIVHDASLCEDPQLVSAAAAAAALELDRERLDAELRARVEELRASRARVVEAADRERHRIERNLHDGAQERLVSLLLSLKLARRGADSLTNGAVKVEKLLDQVERDLTAAVAELRALASGILPPVLRDRGLAAALDELSRRFPLPVTVEDVPAGRLPDRVELAVYFVVSEALTNGAKHARASRARVRVARVGGRVLVEVADDGIGGAQAAAGSGLQGLADRVGALDGHLEVDSPAGRGTTIRAEIPCAS